MHGKKWPLQVAANYYMEMLVQVGIVWSSNIDRELVTQFPAAVEIRV